MAKKTKSQSFAASPALTRQLNRIPLEKVKGSGHNHIFTTGGIDVMISSYFLSKGPGSEAKRRADMVAKVLRGLWMAQAVKQAWPKPWSVHVWENLGFNVEIIQTPTRSIGKISVHAQTSYRDGISTYNAQVDHTNLIGRGRTPVAALADLRESAPRVLRREIADAQARLTAVLG